MLRIHREQRPMMLELMEIEDLGVSCLIDQAGNGNILTREEFEKLAAEMERFYQLIEDQKIEIVINREFPEPSDILAAEGYLHKRFEAKRISGEWFDLAQEDVDSIKSIVGFENDWFLQRVDA